MKILSTLLMLCAAVVGFSQDVNITFELNMNNESVAATGVYIAGGGNFGNPGDNPMTETSPGSGIYSVTITKPQGFSSYYTFTNGNCPDYSCKENLAGLPCGDPANFNDRFVGPIQSDTTIQACFGQCADDGSCTSSDITFQVDMNDYPDSLGSVSVAGTWNGFDASEFPMDETSTPGVYRTTITIPDGNQRYKFIANGTVFEELDPGPCVVSEFGFSNRALTVNGNATLGVVCFGSCLECSAPTVDITFVVNMANETVAPTGVYIAGGGNFGNPGDFPLTDQGGGLWSITVTKPVGFSGNYTFTNGNCPDYSCKENIVGLPCADGPFSDRFTVPINSDTTLLHCFNQCTTDGSCDAPPALRDLTFSLDMNLYSGPEVIDSNSVYVFGSFNGWNPSANLMTETAPGSGVYETTISINDGSYEYLYVLNNGADTEFFGDDTLCTTGPPFNNRILQLSSDSTLATVCWESCSACDSGPDCSAFDTAPVDLTKSFDPVNGVRDRVQVKWFKDTPQVRYSDADAAMCDIKFWPKRNLDPVTGAPVGPAIVAAPGDTIDIVNAKKTFPDNSPREIFKWPVKFRADGANNNKRAEPNIRYEWRVRCECGHDGTGPESPWSATKIFNTPDFDPATGIFDDGAIINPDDQSKFMSQEMNVRVFPNPSSGEAITLVITDDLNGFVDIRVINLSGELIHRQSGNVKDEMIQIDFDQALSSGMYFIQIEANGLIANERFIVK